MVKEMRLILNYRVLARLPEDEFPTDLLEKAVVMLCNHTADDEEIKNRQKKLRIKESSKMERSLWNYKLRRFHWGRRISRI